MKKAIKTSILLLVIACMVVSLLACGKKGTSGEGNGEGLTEDELSVLSAINPDKYKGKTVIFSFSYMGTDEEEEAKATKDVLALNRWSRTARKTFEDATGATIINRPTPAGEDYITRIVTEVTAGVGPDIVNFWPTQKPSWMLKNILIPLSDYIDFESPVYQDKIGVGTGRSVSRQVLEYYTWMGKIYGINGVQMSARVYYNKELFENAGLEDPLELWKRDQWTWDKFFEDGVALTVDKNGDGQPDQWGHITWFYEDGFMASNNVEFVTYDEMGLPRFALDEKFVRAKQAADEQVTKYKMTPPVWWDPNPQERFWNGESAMDYWGYWEMPNMVNNMGEKLGIVPFPRGPDLPPDKKNRDTAEVVAFGITSNSKDPDLAALYLEWVFFEPRDPEEEAKSSEEAYAQYGSKEMYELAMSWAESGAILVPEAYGQGFMDALNKILNKPGDQTWMQAIEANRAACQAALDDFIISGGN